MLKHRREIDRWLAVAVGLLLLIGTIMVYSSSAMLAQSRFSGHTFFFTRQLIWLAISLIVMLLLIRIDYHLLQRFAWPLIVLSTILLIYVLFAPPISGARRWIQLGPVGIQPSEVFKYSLIVFLAAMLAVKREKIVFTRSVVLPAMPVIVLGFGLILLEPNLGTVLVLAAVVLLLFFVAGVRKRLLFLFSAVVISMASFMVLVLGYKRTRLDAYLDSLSDPLQASYQVKQATLAIGSGGLVGKGLGRGFAKLFFLPAPHTDFIFATLAEEGGFIAAVFVLILIGFVIWRGIRIATYSSDLFGFYLALGITMLIFCQSAINLMVAMSLIPVTGLPLPFLSYGGSSVILTSAAIGILLNISRHRVGTAQLFKRRGDG